MGWKPLAAVLLGGVTYISSSCVIAKVLAELRRLDCPETSVLALEDLAMAVYLPLVAALLVSSSVTKTAISESVALATVFLVLFIAVRYGKSLSRFVSHQSDEIILLTTLGTVLFMAGAAQRLQVSAAVGGGRSISGRHRGIGPLADPQRIGFVGSGFNYLADSPPSWADITINHLLSHTSGLVRDPP